MNDAEQLDNHDMIARRNEIWPKILHDTLRQLFWIIIIWHVIVSSFAFTLGALGAGRNQLQWIAPVTLIGALSCTYVISKMVIISGDKNQILAQWLLLTAILASLSWLIDAILVFSQVDPAWDYLGIISGLLEVLCILLLFFYLSSLALRFQDEKFAYTIKKTGIMGATIAFVYKFSFLAPTGILRTSLGGHVVAIVPALLYGLVSVLMFRILWKCASRLPIVAQGRCKKCGYLQCGLDSGRCPECGRVEAGWSSSEGAESNPRQGSA